MSPTSRRKASHLRVVPSPPPGPPDPVAAGAGLLKLAEAFDAEKVGAAFLAASERAGDFPRALLDEVIPALEKKATRGALALLLAFGPIAGGPLAEAAAAAADRLTAAGVRPPRWADQLTWSMEAADGWRLYYADGTTTALSCTFHRAGRTHSFVVMVDHLGGDVATDILDFDDDDTFAEAIDKLAELGRHQDIEVTLETPGNVATRKDLERVLRTRAERDRTGIPTRSLAKDVAPGEIPDYRAMRWLLSARLPTILEKPMRGYDPTRPRLAVVPGSGTMIEKRIYQLKVSLRHAKPPIWRRLEVPAEIRLAKLHPVLQAAFGWRNNHLHVFETPSGEFGLPDRELGHRSERPVSLEQVAPEENSAIQYLYDFGDHWVHDIVVEKILDRDETVTYPRCTGGRRAAPPEDCGGMGGYEQLIAALADPSHPEHLDLLDWLGLDDPTDFDPAAFDAQKVTKALPRLR